MELSFAHRGVLSVLLLLPLLGAIAVFLPKTDVGGRVVGVVVSLIELVLSLWMLVKFQPGFMGMQFAETHAWVPSYGIALRLGIDGLSVYLIVLTTLLTALVLVSSGSVHNRVRPYICLMLLLEVGILGTFMSLDLVSFYVFWELMLIPMYVLIGVWGGDRRRYAAMKFVLYTAFGSLLMLVAIAYLGFAHAEQFGAYSFSLADLSSLTLSAAEQRWLFAAFALAFAIKVPMFPLHTWLPDAHVEAPTGGSVILAGVLLKMGIYGILRFCVPLFPQMVVSTQLFFATLGVIGIVYGALMAWVQDDIKKLVAYSSVSHLGFCVLGLAALNSEGLQGSMLQLLNHGISTGALFLLVGVLYDRKHTRLIADYSGLASKVPVFAAVFLVFTLSSIALPITNGFVGEFLILYGGFKTKPILTAISVFGVVLGAVYMLSLYRRVCFGPLNTDKNGDLTDLSFRERLVFAPLVVLVFVIGIQPSKILKAFENPTKVVLATVQDEGAR